MNSMRTCLLVPFLLFITYFGRPSQCVNASVELSPLAPSKKAFFNRAWVGTLQESGHVCLRVRGPEFKSRYELNLEEVVLSKQAA